MTGENVNSLLVMASPINYSNNASRLIQLTLKHRLPALFGYKENVQAGGLMSYAADVLDLYRRSAVYIDKILKGTKPADLPVESSLRCAGEHVVPVFGPFIWTAPDLSDRPVIAPGWN
jgi:putative ABC transport system substrate-binding protein